MIGGLRRRIVLATIVIGGVVAGLVVSRGSWNVPENVKEARRFLAPYHAVDRSGMTPAWDGSHMSEVTNFEIPVAADVESARLVRELPASHGWLVRPGRFAYSTQGARAISVAHSPLERWISAIPILNRVVRPRGTLVTIQLSARKDTANVEEGRERWARGEMWTSAEVETAGAPLGREARITPKHGHVGTSFSPHSRRKSNERGKTPLRP